MAVKPLALQQGRQQSKTVMQLAKQEKRDADRAAAQAEARRQEEARQDWERSYVLLQQIKAAKPFVKIEHGTHDYQLVRKLAQEKRGWAIEENLQDGHSFFAWAKAA